MFRALREVVRAVKRLTEETPVQTLTPRIAAELISHEGIVPEAYKDSIGVWTWGVGITDASGHTVGRYIDNPQSIEKCLEIYLWSVREKYLPKVLRAFEGVHLTEAQIAAALSFNYNTGAIASASWVKQYVAGDVEGARKAIMNWCKPASLKKRRERERDLFFDGKWTTDGTALVYDVAKPSYHPVNAKRIDIMPALEALL